MKVDFFRGFLRMKFRFIIFRINIFSIIGNLEVEEYF